MPSSQDNLGLTNVKCLKCHWATEFSASLVRTLFKCYLEQKGGEGGGGGEKSPFISHFYLVLPPLVTAKPSSVVLPGQTVTLACEADRPNNRQTLQIHWLDPQGGKTEQESCEVRASSRHSGRWTCVVTLGQKSHSAQMSITVVGGWHTAFWVRMVSSREPANSCSSPLLFFRLRLTSSAVHVQIVRPVHPLLHPR